MNWATLAAIYFIIWWTVLFAVLPWGARSQHDSGEVVEGSEPGAPSLPRLRRKVMWTTVVATVVFGLFYASYATNLITVDRLAGLMGLPKLSD